MSTVAIVAGVVLAVAIVCYLALMFSVDGNGERFFMDGCLCVAAIALTVLGSVALLSALLGSEGQTSSLELFLEWVSGEQIPGP